jgi:hypothetical protein
MVYHQYGRVSPCVAVNLWSEKRISANFILMNIFNLFHEYEFLIWWSFIKSYTHSLPVSHIYKFHATTTTKKTCIPQYFQFQNLNHPQYRLLTFIYIKECIKDCPFIPFRNYCNYYSNQKYTFREYFFYSTSLWYYRISVSVLPQ